MDQTPLQQTVMESREAGTSFPQEAALNLAETPEANQEQAYEPPSYDELFPALPIALSPSSSEVSTPVNSWTKNSDMRIASSVITQVFRVPFEERTKIDSDNQFGESASSRICSQITAETGAHIETSSAKDQSLTFLVTGKSDEVLKAKKMALEKFQTLARQVVKIPKDHHRFIIGKKRKKLIDLETSTSTKIHIPMASHDSEDIYVMGTRDAIEKAVHEIKMISDEQSKQAYEKICVPKIYYPFICGPNSEWINTLIYENHVRVNFPPNSIQSDEISIAGEKEGVLTVKDAILKTFKEMEKKCQTVSVEVKKCQHKYVIGNRGSNITEILQETNVSVEMPSTEVPTGTITLRGPHDKLGQALTMVYEKANSVVKDDVDAPCWLHKFIIGRKGANIKQITQDLKVHVEFSDNEGGIKLEGPPEEVQLARQKLEEMISEMLNRLTYDELSVPPQYYKHIIGKSGANINRIIGKTSVHISIKETDGKNIIRIEGGKPGVAQVKQELEEWVDKMENEREVSLNIEQRFHGNIIGAKGDKIREIREKFNQVQITFPDPGEKSDLVKIRGSKEDVEKCQHFLRRLGKELTETNFQVTVTICRQFHKFIIGKSGSNISKIREDTLTRIELPSEWQNSDDIIITGRKENCEKAKDKILKIQSEMANNTEMDIIIPSKFHNAMIGTGGKLIQGISEQCGGLVSIKFPPSDSKSDKVTIRGPKEDVWKAKQILVDLSNEKQLSSFSAEIRAKPELHRFLIGKNGANIRKIRDKTGAKIIFPSEKDEDKEIITILGRKESVDSAQSELLTIIDELEKVAEMTIIVDPKHHRHFVCRRGEVLRQISDQYGGVTVSFPRHGLAFDKVTVKGPRDFVDGAVNRIQEIVTELEQMTSLEVTIPHKHHRAVMGIRGSRVQNLTSEYDVQIKFPERESQYGDENLVNGDATYHPQDIVIIQGNKDKCEAAKLALLDLIPITEEIHVPFNHHRFIIGQKGESVRSLMTEYDVNVQVPPAEEQKDTITLIGARAKVEAAKAAILKKIEGSFQVQLRIDPEYHPKIIGHKGLVISRIRKKHDVIIRFPMKDSPLSDLITIIGYEKNCNEAKDSILSITGDLESMVKDTVEIDSRIHSRLIGTRGRSIRKVMDDFKVEIKFPRGDEDPNIVVIMGNPENVDDCREHLLNLAEEYVQDITDREDMQLYVKSNSGQSEGDNKSSRFRGQQNQGFVVSGAPWTQPTPNMESSEDFPSMGSSFSTPSITPQWGPRFN